MKRSVTVVLVVIAALFVVQACGEDESENENASVQNISAAEFQQQEEKQPGMIIDVRTQEEYDEGHLANVDAHYNLLNGDFEVRLNSLDKDETYYLYCRTGNRSGQAAELMVENGFDNVYNIGGFQDLVDVGLESE